MDSLTDALRSLVTADKDPLSLEHVEDISGGIVNKAALFKSSSNKYFIKYNGDKNVSTKDHAE